MQGTCLSSDTSHTALIKKKQRFFLNQSMCERNFSSVKIDKLKNVTVSLVQLDITRLEFSWSEELVLCHRSIRPWDPAVELMLTNVNARIKNVSFKMEAKAHLPYLSFSPSIMISIPDSSFLATSLRIFSGEVLSCRQNCLSTWRISDSISQPIFTPNNLCSEAFSRV